jgi:DNA modification methylase
MQKIPIHQWEGCYSKSWNGLIVDEAFKHPAKYSRSLIEKIFDHMEASGWIQPGDLIGDPFGGVGLGGVIAAYRKYLWFGMEIEPRFVEFGNKNFQLHKRRWKDAVFGDACLVLGDSRQFAKGINYMSAVVTSPPYAGISPEAHGPGINVEKNYETYRKSGGGCSFEKFKASREKHSEGYGKTEGQISALKAGSVDGVITSPPYAQSIRGLEHNGIDVDKLKANENHSGKNSMAGSKEIYGKSPGQIARLREGKVDAVITSPPFAEVGGNGGAGINKKGYVPSKGGKTSDVGARTYQGTAGDRCPENIEKLKLGNVDAVITSPPYAETLSHGGGPDTKQDLIQGGKSLQAIKQGYGKAEGQIETLRTGNVDAVITSPPYADIAAGHGGLNSKPAKKPGQQAGRSAKSASQTADQKYGTAEGQIARLPKTEIDAVITSPPWEANTEGGIKGSKVKFVPDSGKGHYGSPEARAAQLKKEEGKVYGDSPGNIGNDKGEDYWQAMSKVYASCFEALKPGGVAAIVIKDYVKNKKRVLLCDDTCRLLEHLGFVMIERIHALLVKETKTADLFEGETTKRTEKKSFFRRLHEKKPGAVRIDWEEVLICQKPYETAFS